MVLASSENIQKEKELTSENEEDHSFYVIEPRDSFAGKYKNLFFSRRR